MPFPRRCVCVSVRAPHHPLLPLCLVRYVKQTVRQRLSVLRELQMARRAVQLFCGGANTWKLCLESLSAAKP